MESEDAGWEFEIEGELELEDAGQGSDIKEDAVQRLPYVVTCSIAGDAKDDSVEKKLKAKASAVEEGKKRLEGFRVMESEELRCIIMTSFSSSQ